MTLHKADLEKCIQSWLNCLKFHNIPRPKIPSDELQLARLLQANGLDAVLMAIEGLRVEPRTESFNPRHFLSLSRLMGYGRIERFVNLGAASLAKRKKQDTPEEVLEVSNEQWTAPSEEVKRKIRAITGGRIGR